MKTYFISDLHFGHRNILRFEPTRIDVIWEMFYQKNPKFKTKEDFRAFVLELYLETKDEVQAHEREEQLKYIISLHDKMLIKKWNEVVRGEDIVWFLGDFCLGGTDAKQYVEKLNGRIRLIKGNHDKKSDAYYKEAGFEFVSSYPIVLKRHFMLMHAPLEDFVPGFFYVYGHVHGSEDYETETANTICACVERHDFKPFLIPGFDNYIDVPAKYPVRKGEK